MVTRGLASRFCAWAMCAPPRGPQRGASRTATRRGVRRSCRLDARGPPPGAPGRTSALTPRRARRGRRPTTRPSCPPGHPRASFSRVPREPPRPTRCSRRRPRAPRATPLMHRVHRRRRRLRRPVARRVASGSEKLVMRSRRPDGRGASLGGGTASRPTVEAPPPQLLRFVWRTSGDVSRTDMTPGDVPRGARPERARTVPRCWRENEAACWSP